MESPGAHRTRDHARVPSSPPLVGSVLLVPWKQSIAADSSHVNKTLLDLLTQPTRSNVTKPALASLEAFAPELVVPRMDISGPAAESVVEETSKVEYEAGSVIKKRKLKMKKHKYKKWRKKMRPLWQKLGKV
ncbi:hypothetical protein SARC_07105 [Sphaeroforma arctica JP610]|uniref:Small ribosomal subunit protein mS38 n=1 Tax=Sphaeroforma arctica JP610 TaxID=667725 RepID=A0A0L0FX52_9EUKA|nr:hypothetical protein SARC_07105 [Sphaeroforma arctica JP610]KNC80533.1 hypothetical protein SARC_07105 [Sphaeroforma arctica JP610]|eukprot:XP_014154435.1 hypothetical protein SARC_07105 [Sphaeroforma arctica JP610]